ncbi:MAG: hypothetical protein QXU32_06575 [Nitrososphaerales archaeon]
MPKTLREKGFTQVSIPNEIADILDTLIESGDFEYESRAKIVVEALKQWLSDRGYYPLKQRFEHINMSSERIVIKDNRERSMVSIVKRNGQLYCEYDQSKDCDHIRFANLLDGVKKLRKK